MLIITFTPERSGGGRRVRRVSFNFTRSRQLIALPPSNNDFTIQRSVIMKTIKIDIAS